MTPRREHPEPRVTPRLHVLEVAQHRAEGGLSVESPRACSRRSELRSAPCCRLQPGRRFRSCAARRYGAPCASASPPAICRAVAASLRHLLYGVEVRQALTEPDTVAAAAQPLSEHEDAPEDGLEQVPDRAIAKALQLIVEPPAEEDMKICKTDAEALAELTQEQTEKKKERVSAELEVWCGHREC